MYTLVNISGIALKHVSPPVAGSGILERGEGGAGEGKGDGSVLMPHHTYMYPMFWYLE